MTTPGAVTREPVAIHPSIVAAPRAGENGHLGACPRDPAHRVHLRGVAPAIEMICDHGCDLRPGRYADGRLMPIRELMDQRRAAEQAAVLSEVWRATVAPVLVNLATVAPRTVEWTWRGRIPRGKLTLAVGNPDLGKSYVSLDIASRITRGAAWPDGGQAPLGNVLLISAEDGVDDTIVPRLLALGADMTRVTVLQAVRDDHGDRALNLAHDLDVLDTAITRTDALMVGIDPLSAYVGAKDSWKDADVRAVLGPVAALADARRVALLAIMHLTKNSDRQALHRVLGSVAFIAACRSALAFAPHPDHEDRRVVVNLKHNLARQAAALAYELVTRDGAELPIVEWYPEDRLSVTDIEQLVSPPRRTTDRRAEQVVQRFLDELFAEADAILAANVYRAARLAGVAEGALKRGKGPYRSVKENAPDGKWWWIKPGVHDLQLAILRAQTVGPTEDRVHVRREPVTG